MKGTKHASKIINDFVRSSSRWCCLLLFAIAFLTACDNQGSDVSGDLDRSGKAQKITVYVYETSADMQNAKAEFLNTRRERDLLGWAKWTNRLEDGCEIHVVKLRGDNDSRMKTWGHELAHCVYGSYHSEQ